MLAVIGAVDRGDTGDRQAPGVDIALLYLMGALNIQGYDALPHCLTDEGELLLGVKSERTTKGLAEVNDAKEVPQPGDHILVESVEPELLLCLAGLV